MEVTKFGQRFWPEEADEAFPGGCRCRDGSCDWCQVYYNGPNAEGEDE